MRPSFFPRETHVFHAFEMSAWRTLSLRVVDVAAVTGMLLRGLRAVALTQSQGMAMTATAFALGALILLGALTMHLANYPVRRWPGRVLAFAVVEAAAEIVVSAALIVAHREPLGTARHYRINERCIACFPSAADVVMGRPAPAPVEDCS